MQNKKSKRGEKNFEGMVKVYNDEIFISTKTGVGVDFVLKKMDPLLSKMASRTYLPGYRFEDIKQELSIIAIEGIKNYYVAKGWTAGPHLFVIGNPPDPSTAGIWQMTPLNMRGIHAGRYNTTHWGIEVVGNYDAQPWGTETHDLVLGAAGALLQWQKIPATYNTVKGHRETGSPKTCPGKLVNMDSFRYDLAALLRGR